MTIHACLVCGENENGRRQLFNKRRTFIDCPKCGRFEISDALELEFSRPDPGTRERLPYLSAHIRQAPGGSVPFISSDNWEEFAASRSTTPLHEKGTKLLALIA